MFAKRPLLYRILLTLLTCFAILPTQGLAAERVIYATGFEQDNGQYQADEGFWQYGAPNTAAKPEGPAACNGGQKCWGTSLSAITSGTGNVVSPAITIPTLAAGQVARLSFHAYIEVAVMASNAGYGDIYISSDNKQTWKKLAHLLEKMAGGWQRYDLDISEFAGQTVNLRFYCFMASDAADVGFYLDDVAITIVDLPTPSKTLTLRAWEDPADYASCPWAFTWDGTRFVQDNDIYSVARGVAGKQRDFYLLQKPLVPQDGQYRIEVRELEAEDSWTDYLALKTIDHAPDVAVAPDSHGTLAAYKPAALLAPLSALNKVGGEVRGLVATANNAGYQAYGGDYLDVSFPAVDPAGGARVVLRIKGFIRGEGDAVPYTEPPAVLLQVAGPAGSWQEIGRLNPRFDWSVGAFDVTRYLPDPPQPFKMRLSSISHDVKFHEVDLVALSPGAQPPFGVTELNLAAASYGGRDVREVLNAADGQSVQMGSGNAFGASFTAPPLADGQARDFLLVSEGYYIPHGDTFFIYTWNGTTWVQRDAVSFTSTSSSNMETKVFDLSSYLPDPSGEFKVRIWQDYRYESAYIDYVGMTVDSITGVLATAIDMRGGSDIKDLVAAVDSQALYFGSGERNRWTEFKWSGLPDHVPPSIPAGGLSSLGGNIRWSYYSPTQDAQTAFDVQVWTGAAATGNIMWSPITFTGASSVVRYNGELLVPGTVYYLRVRLFDGKAWGAWTEVPFRAPLRNGILATEGSIPTLVDALKAVRIVTGALTATDADLDTGDIAPLDPATGLSKGDGKIDIFDVIGILRRMFSL
ncbi:hypothetical protein GMLC_19420 [Geomonas limicola]|uniref:Fibronectin type-III domain-containing protein n=1 Tax=Geomonas limicola TaxID=2740186 RepID=A0A6V8NA06_9BACT|nr:hypothetical protein [Geomonas limicola]GFO68363.1 hypothetical protein GMLC_19420 [Geomonas limicola]